MDSFTSQIILEYKSNYFVNSIYFKTEDPSR